MSLVMMGTDVPSSAPKHIEMNSYFCSVLLGLELWTLYMLSKYFIS